jgi:arylsulfatase A-like enzyme
MHGAVCIPSRASLMTGRNIFASSVNPGGGNFSANMTIPPDLPTFPEALRQTGYRTHAIGKWHNDTATFHRSFSSGDALMFRGMSDHRQVPLWSYDPEGIYPGANAVNFDVPRRAGDETGRFTIGKGFSSNIFADAAIDFLNRDRGEDPFLLYVAFTAPHDPRTPPPGWEIDPASIDLPPNFLPQHPFDNGEMAVRDELLAAHPRTEGEIRQHIADYYGMIAHLDHSIGRIIEAISANDLTGDTIVIYTGDHGLAVGQHGLLGKQNLYEHSLRVPLVLAGPGIPAGVISDALVWHADTTATIRALAGVEPDPASEGSPYIADGVAAQMHRETLGAAYEYGQRMFRDARYKLIVYNEIPEQSPRTDTTPGSNRVQLFDLASDPWEMVNLADDPAYRQIRERLERGLHEWQIGIDDPMLELVPSS